MGMIENLNSAAIMQELLRYEAATGKLYWSQRDLKWFRNMYNAHIFNAACRNTPSDKPRTNQQS